MENFYVTCSSNLHLDKYNTNLPHHFITPLIKPMKLSTTEWQVGITEISYPTSYHNINDNETRIRIFHEGLDIFDDHILAGLYTVRELIESINDMIKAAIGGELVHFSLHVNASKVLIIVNEGYELHINEYLSQKLGFKGYTIFNSSRLAKQCADLDIYNSCLYVNCNLIEETYNNNAFIKLLRSIPITNKTPGQQESHIFTKPYYKDVKGSHINEIEFELTSLDGVPFMFYTGTIIIVLHFKKKSKK